jgi:cell division protein FtsA
MEEILDAVIYEVENSGYFEKLGAGIVITGGGALLKHLPALVKFKTGLDVRIGYPTEHLATDAISEVNHPMFSTSVGLVLEGFHNMDRSKRKVVEIEPEVELELEEKLEETKMDKKDNKAGFMSSLKKVFTDIFDEDDAEM